MDSLAASLIHPYLLSVMILTLSFFFFILTKLFSLVALLFSFISTLSKQFAMKDLGDLHYFLGVQVTRSSLGLFLS